MKNHIYKAKNLELKNLIEIFDEIYNSRIKNIFVAMPFSKDFDDVWDKIVDVYDGLIKEGYQLDKSNKYGDRCMPNRIDKTNEVSKDLIVKIKESIDKCDLVIADLTNANPNVYYEVGLAEAQGKNCIFIYDIRKQESKVHFDLMTMERVEYSSFGELRERLRKKLGEILKLRIVEPL